MKQRKKKIWWYVAGDYVASVAAWYCLFLFRKVVIEANPFNLQLPFSDNTFWIAMLVVPMVWWLFHYLTGTYFDLYRKSRVQELGKTFIVSFLGCIILFFTLLLDDYVRKYSDYYLTFFVLLFFQFLFTATIRMLILNALKAQVRRGKVGFATLMIGSSGRADELYKEVKEKKESYGFKFIGYLQVNGSTTNTLTTELKNLGRLNELERVMDAHPDIEEIVIAIESSEHPLLKDILTRLADRKVTIRIIPDMYDILSGTVKMNHLVGEGFIEIHPFVLNEWERITKRWFDVIASLGAIIATCPVWLFIAFKIWWTDKGPVFYTQERLGRYGKPFRIIKFRSMYINAEQAGPQLTTEDDPRITPIGKFIRKYRIDEFPQFVNVLKGEMSIVGPRAERRYFADRIIQVAPYYRHVFKVQPGITSLGMVKYGYASTVEEMVKRLKYDIIYMENMNLIMDLKIMAYTVQTILYGRGK